MSEALAKPKPLTDKQRQFADLWAEALARGADFNQADIAKAAGYEGNSLEALHVSASRTLALPHVRRYLYEKARDYLQDGAFEAAVTMRALIKRSESDRVRGDMASKLLTGIGMLAPEQVNQGSGVTVQIVFRTDAGETLAQRMSSAANIVDSTATSEDDTRLEQARVTGPRRVGRGKAPPGGVDRAAPGEAGAVENPARSVPSRGARKSPAKKGQGRKNPGPPKPRKKVVPDGS